MRGLADRILLEGPIHRVAGERGTVALGFVGLPTKLAGQAGPVQPFDAGVIANLKIVD